MRVLLLLAFGLTPHWIAIDWDSFFFFNLYILYVELIEFVIVNMCVRTHQSDMHILTCMQ